MGSSHSFTYKNTITKLEPVTKLVYHNQIMNYYILIDNDHTFHILQTNINVPYIILRNEKYNRFDNPKLINHKLKNAIYKYIGKISNDKLKKYDYVIYICPKKYLIAENNFDVNLNKIITDLS